MVINQCRVAIRDRRTHSVLAKESKNAHCVAPVFLKFCVFSAAGSSIWLLGTPRKESAISQVFSLRSRSQHEEERNEVPFLSRLELGLNSVTRRPQEEWFSYEPPLPPIGTVRVK